MTLDRFLEAQGDPDAGFETARGELARGRKESHWIWYVFPQLPFGSSPMAQLYSIADVSEAEAYLRHDVLRERLLEITNLVHAQLARGVPLETLMGSRIDCLKLVSSLTLFEGVAEHLGGPDAGALATAVREVLAAASRQGYPACRMTCAALKQAYP